MFSDFLLQLFKKKRQVWRERGNRAAQQLHNCSVREEKEKEKEEKKQTNKQESGPFRIRRRHWWRGVLLRLRCRCRSFFLSTSGTTILCSFLIFNLYFHFLCFLFSLFVFHFESAISTTTGAHTYAGTFENNNPSEHA